MTSATNSSLRDRFLEDLRAGSLPVLLTAIPLAIVAGVAAARYWDASAVGFLLLVTIGVLVPYVHETALPQDRPWTRDVPWTVAASAVAGGLFAGSYALVGAVLVDPTHAAAVAFVATCLVGAGLLRLVR